MAAYPLHLVRRRRLADQRPVTIRPVRAGDDPAAAQLPERRRLRFVNFVQAPGGALVHFLTPIDYDRHMAFVGEAEDGVLIGEARYLAIADGRGCEFGVVVADAWRHSGVAPLLMDALIRAAQARRLETMAGLVLRDDHDMLRFTKSLGFEPGTDPLNPAQIRVTKRL